MSLQLMTS